METSYGPIPQEVESEINSLKTYLTKNLPSKQKPSNRHLEHPELRRLNGKMGKRPEGQP